MKKRVWLIELNEFNRELIKDCATLFGLENLQKLLQLPMSETHTADHDQTEYLEPWVQWVNIHTGKPSQEHRVKHLGDTPGQELPQLWEKLAEKGLKSGIWGAMNAARSDCEQCLFFMPDPWTFSQEAHPPALNAILNPFRLVAKNYLNHSFKELIQQGFKLLKWSKRERLLGSLFRAVATGALNQFRFKGEPMGWIVPIEAFSFEAFMKMKKIHDPDFSILFINSLAHVQHHHWKDFNYLQNEKMRYCLATLDKIFEKIFAEQKENESLICMNALSQMNTAHELPWVLYRQYDQKKFLKACGMTHVKVESHMTHDAHLFFSDVAACQSAFDLLNRAKVGPYKLFFVEAYPQEPKKLFYKLIVTHELDQEAQIDIDGKTLRFFDYFKPIVRRTGRHIPTGTLLSDYPHFKKKMGNHEVHDAILNLMVDAT